MQYKKGDPNASGRRHSMTNSNTSDSVVPLVRLTAADVAEWQRLADELRSNPSLGPHWTKVTAQSHGLIDRCRVLLVRRGSDLVATIPFVVRRRRQLGWTVSVLTPIASLVSNHNTLVARMPADEAVAWLVSLAERERCDLVDMANVSDDSMPLDAWSTCASSIAYVDRRVGEASPYLPLEMSWDALLASKPKKFRYKVRKREGTLEQESAVSMRWYCAAEDCAALLAAMEVVEANSWKHEERVSIFGRPHERLYYELLLPYLARSGALAANVLFVGSQPVAYGLCCQWNGWAGLLKTSFDRAYAELSPGSILTDQCIRRAIERGATEFDFLGDSDPYKLSWTRQVRGHTTYHLYLRGTIKGRLAAAARAVRARLSGTSQSDRRAAAGGAVT